MRPALIWEMPTDAARAVVEAQQDVGSVLGGDVALDRLGRALGREGLDRAGRLLAHRDERRQVGHHLDDVQAGDEARQVEPVRADVADGAERAATLGLEPPVPVGLEQQPVLEVAAGDQADVAEPAVRTTLATRAG